MTYRPIYVGVGECRCGRLDAALYRSPGASMMDHLACARCLADQGVIVTRPRTADDLELVDGVPQWKTSASTPHVDATGVLDLGGGHTLEAVFDADDLLAGWLHRHPHPDGNTPTPCQTLCAVRYIDGVSVYRVDQADPLTLSPAVRCRLCGVQGHVVRGVWVPV